MKGSSSHFCLLIEKPENCPQESFDQLHEVFKGDLCEDQDFPILGGEDSLPPAYLTVPQFRDYDDYHIYWPFYGPPNISPLSQNSIVDQFRI